MSDSTKYSAKLKGRKVLVVGGSSGIGFGAAEASIENGATVIISSSNQARIDDAVARILKSYPSAKHRISGVTCNLADVNTLEQNVIDLLEKVGTVDHISEQILPRRKNSVVDVLNSSFCRRRIKNQTLVRDYRARCNPVLRSPILCAAHDRKAAAKHMTSGPQSSITLTTGGITLKPLPNWELVAGTMCAATGLMRGLALDLAPIRVNIVNPGATRTELWDHMSKEEFDKFVEHCESTNPTGRLAAPEDIAEAYLYLMKNIDVTGTEVMSHGGAFLK